MLTYDEIVSGSMLIDENTASGILLPPDRTRLVKAGSMLIDENIASGIYFLISYGEIVYVGQSRSSIMGRIKSHLTDKEFDSYFIYPANPNDLDDLETFYITQFTPKYNKSVKAINGLVFIGMLHGDVENSKGTVECISIGGKLYANTGISNFNLKK